MLALWTCDLQACPCAPTHILKRVKRVKRVRNTHSGYSPQEWVFPAGASCCVKHVLSELLSELRTHWGGVEWGEQLVGMRYGALPIVRRTGGLGDTVHDLDDPRGQTGNGFAFDGASHAAFSAFAWHWLLAGLPL